VRDLPSPIGQLAHQRQERTGVAEFFQLPVFHDGPFHMGTTPHETDDAASADLIVAGLEAGDGGQSVSNPESA
jgi:hypothetical protein